VRALRYTTAGLVVDSKAAEPVGQLGHAIIRPTRLGLHPIDVAVARGWTTHAGIIGRECIGLVESVSATPEEAARWTGKRVLLQSALVCGTCAQCRGGNGAHCPERRVAGVCGRDGFCADRIAAPLNSLVEVPKTIGEDVAIFAYAMADAMHTTQVIRAEGKTFVTVLGDTLDALLVARLMAARNATVRLLCHTPATLTQCEKWGIRARPMSEVGLRHDQSVVVDCSHEAAQLGPAVQMLRPKGTLILRSAFAAVPQRCWNAEAKRAQAVVPTDSVIANEITIIGARAATLAEGLDLVSKAGTDLLPLITRRFKLSEGVSAMRAAADPAHLKVVIEL
jgi:threonine dehydrogenase-like Zn-dependent dehydrogenase